MIKTEEGNNYKSGATADILHHILRKIADIKGMN